MPVQKNTVHPLLTATLLSILILSSCSARMTADEKEMTAVKTTSESSAQAQIDKGEFSIVTTKLSYTDKELEATFARNKAAATIMFLKGGPRHPDFVIEPGVDSPYEFDYLVLNREGDLLIGGFGGSEAMEKGWNKYLEASPEHVDALERHSDLFLTRDAVKKLASHPEIGELFEWVIKTLMTSIDYAIKEHNLTDPGR